MGNKIVQLRDENGNNIYPLSYVSSNVDLVYTNSTITSDYATGTFEIDLSTYSMVVICYKYSKSLTTDVFGSVIPVGMSSIDIVMNTAAADVYRRSVDVSSTGVTFSGCVKSTSTASNGFMIPYKVYGIR